MLNARWRLRVAAAFATLYLVWGSTYLAIRIGVEHLPPALFGGTRFLLAGGLLLPYALAAGQRLPRETREWRMIIVTSLLLLVCANGLVVFGEQWVASNLTALIVASTALWLAGFGALGREGHRPARGRLVGLGIGFAGVALLLAPQGDFQPGQLLGALAMLAASLAWAAGSIINKRARPTTAPLMAAALQSLIAGIILCAIGLLLGELPRWQWEPRALGALAYLVVFGSCLAYGAYVWLLHEVTPSMLGTYAYINPLVAVLLGWAVLGETLDSLQFVAMAVILAGVVMVSRR